MADLAGGRRFFINSRLQAGKAADGELVNGIAGTVRWLHEYTNGTNVAGCQPVAPGSPGNRNIPGHDHSGGIMGVPFKQTVWSCFFGSHNSSGLLIARPPMSTYVTNSGRASGGSIPSGGEAVERCVFIPPGHAYKMLTPEFLIYPVDENVDVICKIWSPYGVDPSDGEPYSASATLTANSDNYVTFTSKSVPFIPGRIQTFMWRVFVSNDGGAGISSVYLKSIALHQDSTSV